MIKVLLKAGFYYDRTIKIDRDIPPKGHTIFVMSAGHSKPTTKPYIETVHLPRRDYQIIYVHRGTMHYFDKNGTEFIAPEGSFVLYKPLEYQKYIIYLNENSDIYWCHFAGAFAEVLLKNYKLLEQKLIILSSHNKYRRLYTAMRTALENKPKFYIELCGLYLQELIITIGSEIDNKLSQDNMPDSLKIALEYIHEHYFENITVMGLAKISASNKITLTRQFEKHLQCSPKKFLNKFRIDRAKTLLLQTDHKINEIALAVGFQDPLYFSTAFRTEIGISPREYRNQNR